MKIKNLPPTQIYIQEIIFHRSLKTLAYEVLFRPISYINSSVESFYQNLSEDALLSLTFNHLHQLTNIDWSSEEFKSSTCLGITHLFINIEPRCLSLVCKELICLNDTLKQRYGIELILEITERLSRTQLKSTFKTVEHLKDAGLKIAIDDFELRNDLRTPWLNTGVIDIVKLTLPSNLENDKKKRLKFYENIYRLDNIASLKVIIEKVETIKQFRSLELLPYYGLQGFLFSQPKLIQTK